MRVAQPQGARGSLKWIQRAINDYPSVLALALQRAGLPATDVRWVSPLRDDSYAEYRDGSFLCRIGHPELMDTLKAFWPARGPQWDALGVIDGEVALVEAKAHISEMLADGTQAGEVSAAKIEAALATTAEAYGARPRAPWSQTFYQLANRLAFLHFLNSNGVPARLILVNFVGDDEMGGPSTSDAWRGAYEVALHVMGLPRRHPYIRRIVEVFPHIYDLV